MKGRECALKSSETRRYSIQALRFPWDCSITVIPLHEHPTVVPTAFVRTLTDLIYPKTVRPLTFGFLSLIICSTCFPLVSPTLIRYLFSPFPKSWIASKTLCDLSWSERFFVSSDERAGRD